MVLDASVLSGSVGNILLTAASVLVALASITAVLRSARLFRVGSVELSFGSATEVSSDRLISHQQAVIEAVRDLGEENAAAQSETPTDQRLRDLSGEVRRLVAESERRRVVVEQQTEKLLREYHAQGLTQSRVAFLFSIVFASLGFVLIAATVVVAVAAGTHTGANAVALISGAIVEAVSGLFFVQSNRARITMTAFFDKLRQDRSLDEALRLSDSIPDPLIKSRLKTVLSLRLAGADASDDALRTVLATEALPPSLEPVAPKT